MAILRNLFETAQKLNLPDLGVSERLGIATPKSTMVFNAPTPAGSNLSEFLRRNAEENVSRNTAGINYISPQEIQSWNQPRVAGAQVNNPAGIQPHGGGLAPNPDAGTRFDTQTQEQPTSNIYQETQDRLNKEAESAAALREQQANEIFSPLVGNFNAQIDRLPSELSSLQGGVNAGAQASRDLVGKQLEGSLSNLGKSEANVREQTGKSLRNLAEEQRGLTTSIARQLGARGAGDTSAGDYSGAAIGRQGLKQRGSALEAQAASIRDIEQQRFQARNIADQENIRIEQAKQQQLQSLAADFQGIQRQLENAKASASSDKRRYIAEQQNALREELSKRLNDIDSEVRQRKAALEDWGVQQETLLANGLRQLQQRGLYDATDVYGQLQKASQIASQGGYQLTPQGAQTVQDVFTPGIGAGLFEPKPDKSKDPIDALIEQSLTQ